MSITLTPEVQAQVRRKVEGGQDPDAEAVIVKALEAQEQARFLKTRELILAGLNSGPGEELTEELWDRLEQEAEEAYQRGEKPRSHACP